jgi:hypothetical protein
MKIKRLLGLFISFIISIFCYSIFLLIQIKSVSSHILNTNVSSVLLPTTMINLVAFGFLCKKSILNYSHDSSFKKLLSNCPILINLVVILTTIYALLFYLMLCLKYLLGLQFGFLSPGFGSI